jgi:hypothetical protein
MDLDCSRYSLGFLLLQKSWIPLKKSVNRPGLLIGVRIPMHRGHLLRFDRGQATDLMAATIPI